ncbi:MAG: 50S ribosomal protein L4 [Anaerolineae bacterium]|nr:50S ribosomal protein L4 [Anaerolineae bacterium]
MRLPVHDMTGQKVGEADLPDDIFGIEPNVPVMHQALVRQLANARLGTHDTKGRSEVSGGGRKPWRQKGTGRARQGSIRAPQWRKGGTVFGPTPRSYRQRMPRKMRRLALRSALSVKAAEESIVLLDRLEMEAPRTKDMEAVLANLALDDSVLILLPDGNWAVERSARNLPHVKTLRANYLNVRDLLKYRYVLMPLASLKVIQGWLAQE